MEYTFRSQLKLKLKFKFKFTIEEFFINEKLDSHIQTENIKSSLSLIDIKIRSA